jgi:hypothetical protein
MMAKMEAIEAKKDADKSDMMACSLLNSARPE